MSDSPKRFAETIDALSAADLASSDATPPAASFSLDGPVPTIDTGSLRKSGTVDEKPTLDGDELLAPSRVVVPSAPAAPKTDNAPQHTVDFQPAEPAGTLDREQFDFSAGPVAPKATAIKVPKHVAGYEIVGVLGRGGMGVVYKARQPGLKRLVALKMILAGGHASEHDLFRFRSEAEAVARLQHPNIVQIYEVGDDDGRPYFSLEFVDGTSLARDLDGRPLPHGKAAEMLAVLARAMAYAHEHGIVHRDLKPGNILVATDGTPKITDFGLAKRVEDEDNSQTRSGTILGTPDYMAPEQASGNTKDVGPLADVYALGSMLYEFLTGRPPFRSASMLETLQQVITKEPMPPSQLDSKLPRDLETICLKCLQKEPAKRYAGAAELAEDLRRYLAGEPILARPVSPAERAWRWCRRNPRTAALSAAVVGLVIVWAGTASGLALRLKHEKDATVKARDLAEKNEKLAKKHAGEALENANQAKKNAALARKNEEQAKQSAAEALHSAEVAKQNEKIAKDQHDQAAKQFVALGADLEGLLRKKRTQQPTGPELRALQDEVLNLVERNVVMLAEAFDASRLSDFTMVVNCQRLGNLLARLGHGEQAMRQYEQGYQLAKRLADATPNDDLAHGNLAAMRFEMAKTVHELNDDTATALAWFLEARDLWEQLRADPRQNHPWESHVYNRWLAFNERGAGECELGLGHPAKAREHLKAALAHRLAWVQAQPGNLEAISWLSEAYLWMGMAASHLNDSEAVQTNFGECLKIIHVLVKEHPADWSLLGDLAEVEGRYGDAQWRLGNRAAAREWYEKSLQHDTTALERLAKDGSQYMDRYVLSALAYERLGAIERAGGDKAAAEAHYAKALAIRAELAQVDPLNLSWQAADALTLAHCGQTVEAAKKAEDVARRAPKGKSLLIQAARCYTLCSASAADADERAHYLDLALDALRSATANDFSDPIVLATDPDLMLLADRPEWQSLLSKTQDAARKAEERKSP